MLLHELLDETVADVTADLPALAAASRHDGVGLRRRRRVRTTLASAAVVAVVAGGAYALVPGDDPEPLTALDRGITAAPLPTGSSPGAPGDATAPITGRGAVAALMDAVDRVAAGTFSDPSGADPVVGDPTAETSARFLFQPSSGGPATDVFLNLQRIPRDEDPASVTCAASYMIDCAVTPLSGGDTLRTYTDRISSGSPGYQRRVAELRSPARGLRVILGASNTRDGDTTLAGVEPALSTDQLAAVVSEPWWGLRELPADYVEAGERLAPYRDHGGAIGVPRA